MQNTPPPLPPPVNYCYCSQAEARARQASSDIHYLEATVETRDFRSKDRLFDPCRVVSKYSRSAAGTSSSSSSGGAETGRTFEQLEETVRYLNMTIWRDDKVGRIEMKYEFVMDRLRAVAQELIIAQERPHPRINTIITDILRTYCNLLRDIMLYFDQIVDHSASVTFFLNFRSWFIWENHSKAMRNIMSLIVDDTHKAEAAVNFKEGFGEREEIYMIQFLLICIDKIHYCLCQFKDALPITGATACREFAVKMSESGFMAAQLSEHYHHSKINPEVIHFFSSFYSAIFVSPNLSRAVKIYYEEMYFKGEKETTNKNIYRKYSGTLLLILISYFRILRFVGINKSSLSNSTISKVSLAKQLWVIREDLTCIAGGGGSSGVGFSKNSNSNINSITCNSDVLSIAATSTA